MVERLKAEAPRFAHIFPQLPRLVHQVLEHHSHPRMSNEELFSLLLLERRRTNRLLGVLAALGGAVVLGLLAMHYYGALEGVV
jgi:ubiquinone biosynthesis protein